MLIAPIDDLCFDNEPNNLAVENMTTTFTKVEDLKQQQFENALRELREKKSRPVEKMATKQINHGESQATGEDTRLRQIGEGFKAGGKKGVVRAGTRKLASKLTEMVDLKDNLVADKFAQLALLLGSAEIVERLPSGVSAKVGLDADRREHVGGLFRFVAGENLGRDALELASIIAPILLDKLQGVSTEDLLEMAEEAEQERQEQHTDVEQLLANSSVKNG